MNRYGKLFLPVLFFAMIHCRFSSSGVEQQRSRLRLRPSISCFAAAVRGYSCWLKRKAAKLKPNLQFTGFRWRNVNGLKKNVFNDFKDVPRSQRSLTIRYKINVPQCLSGLLWFSPDFTRAH